MSAKYSIGNVKKLLATAALSAGVLLAAAPVAHAESAPRRDAPSRGVRVARQVLAATVTTAGPLRPATATTATTATSSEAPRCRVGNTKQPRYADCQDAQAAGQK